MMIKLLYTTPLHLTIFQFFLQDFYLIPRLESLQPPILIEISQFPCHLHHYKKT